MSEYILKGIRKLDGERRSTLYIGLEILEKARNGIGLTKLVFNRNLNFSIVKAHLERLEKEGLVERQSGIIKTTEKGKELLKYVHGIDILLKSRVSTL